MVERIGILGGSFDPVHNGHLGIARAALRAQKLDRVLFLPAAVQPFKRNGPRASDADRLEMLRLAIAREPRFEICELELERGGVSFLFDTLVELRGLHPCAKLFFIVGMDALRDLRSWHRAEELPRLCEFLAAARPGFAPPEDAPPHKTFPCRGREISSSDIRGRIAQKLAIGYLVPRAVAGHIRRHGLYQKETPET